MESLDFVQETKKRNREYALIFFLVVLFLFLTWFEFRLFAISKQLPFMHSIYFLGLVNFNIILLLLLFFLIFRNLFKAFVEKEKGVFGSSLKSRLITSFLVFSFIPTVLMLLVSVFYINSSFDKWFNEKMKAVLKNALEVTSLYYNDAKERNFHVALNVVKRMESSNNKLDLNKFITEERKSFGVDAVEYYSNVEGERVISLTEDESIPLIPAADKDFLSLAIDEDLDSSKIQPFSEGNLVRVIVPVKSPHKGALVISTFVPLSLFSKMNDIATAYEELREANPLEYPIKSIYLIILVMMTLVILLCATWFGFYMAKHLSATLEVLGQATRQVSEGNYRPVLIQSGETEVVALAENFNHMILRLEQSRREVLQANDSLRDTLNQLNERSRYIQVVLSNIKTGVISLDPEDNVTTINDQAEILLKVNRKNFLGKQLNLLLGETYYRLYRQMVHRMQVSKLNHVQREFHIEINNVNMPTLLTITLLFDQNKKALGKVIVFDDLTPVINAQRAAAWREVARRIAHEIKNPLTPIKLSAQRLMRRFGDQIQDPAFKMCTEIIVEQTDHIKNLVNEFAKFARMPEKKARMSDINDIMEKSLALYDEAHKKVKFEFSKEDIEPFLFDPEQLQRVIINLLDNAVRATKDKPAPLIRLSSQYDRSQKLVTLKVEDNGIGISNDKRSRIFEPYFTETKGGTGLGLAIVKKIVEDHDGVIKVIDTELGGVGFSIEIPHIRTSVT